MKPQVLRVAFEEDHLDMSLIVPPDTGALSSSSTSTSTSSSTSTSTSSSSSSSSSYSAPSSPNAALDHLCSATNAIHTAVADGRSIVGISPTDTP